MHILMIDGHPARDRLSAHLLDLYEAALPTSAAITRIALADITFDPVLAHGYAQRQEWEPDLLRLAEALDQCDHLVVAFPLWWGAEPARLKGLLDRLLLPGFAFAYHANDPWWDRLLEGRSADVMITMDTPPLYLRLAYGNAVVKRWRKQVLGFCGFNPVRILPLGPVRHGGAAKAMPKWQSQIDRMSRRIRTARPDTKQLRLGAFLHGGD